MISILVVAMVVVVAVEATWTIHFIQWMKAAVEERVVLKLASECAAAVAVLWTLSILSLV
jgi:hypothetical protein